MIPCLWAGQFKVLMLSGCIPCIVWGAWGHFSVIGGSALSRYLVKLLIIPGLTQPQWQSSVKMQFSNTCRWQETMNPNNSTLAYECIIGVVKLTQCRTVIYDGCTSPCLISCETFNSGFQINYSSLTPAHCHQCVRCVWVSTSRRLVVQTNWKWTRIRVLNSCFWMLAHFSWPRNSACLFVIPWQSASDISQKQFINNHHIFIRIFLQYM